MIVVVADDFSGAAEVAGVAFEMGLSAEVQVDALRPSVCDVVVVDSNTRSRSSIDAASVNRRLAEQIAKVIRNCFTRKSTRFCEDPLRPNWTRFAKHCIGSGRFWSTPTHASEGSFTMVACGLMINRSTTRPSPSIPNILERRPGFPRCSSHSISVLKSLPMKLSGRRRLACWRSDRRFASVCVRKTCHGYVDASCGRIRVL